MSRTKIINNGDENIYAIISPEDEEWICIIDDKDIKLKLCLRFMDSKALGLDIEDEEYPIVVEACIIPSEEYISEEAIEIIKEDLGFDVDDIDLEDILINTDYGAPIDLTAMRQAGRIDNYKDCKIIKNEYWLKSDFDPEEFVNIEVLPVINAVFSIIGLYLDRKSRPIGSTGWDEIEFFLSGRHPYKHLMQK